MFRRFLIRLVGLVDTKRKAKINLLRIISSSRVLITIYYFFKGSYDFEKKGTLIGIKHFLQDTSTYDGFPIYQLIRNIHRIEKGLSVKDEHRRPVFAEDYIVETVKSLKRIVGDVQIEADNFSGTQAWAFDVLSTYFNTIKKTATVERAEEIFQQLPLEIPVDKNKRVPMARINKEYSSINYEDLKNLALQRRSVRHYRSSPVPREKIDKAIEVAALSPSACNRQAFRFLVYDKPKWVEDICQILPGIDYRRNKVPCVICIVGNQAAYFDERDRHLIYIDGSLAAMSFQLALETLGLSSCCINWPSIVALEKKMHKLLDLREYERIVMFLSVGYPEPQGLIPYSQKRSVEELRIFHDKEEEKP